MITPIIHHSLRNSGLGSGKLQSMGPIGQNSNLIQGGAIQPHLCSALEAVEQIQANRFLPTPLQRLLGIPREGQLPPASLHSGCGKRNCGGESKAWSLRAPWLQSPILRQNLLVLWWQGASGSARAAVGIPESLLPLKSRRYGGEAFMLRKLTGA